MRRANAVKGALVAQGVPEGAISVEGRGESEPMVQTDDGGGHFTSAVLRPKVTIADPAQAELAASLHAQAASKCFIAASVNFPVDHEPELLTLA